jgi:hypothetical protein
MRHRRFLRCGTAVGYRPVLSVAIQN